MNTNLEAHWDGSGNLFWKPVVSSIVGGVRISYAYLNILDAKKGEGAIQLLMYNDYLPRHTNLELKTGLKGSQLIGKEGLTGVAVDNFELISGKISYFQDETVRAGFGRKSFEFGQIWAKNLRRFYEGSRTSKEGAFSSTATSMDAYPGLAALAIEVRAFHDNELVGSVHAAEVAQSHVSGTGGEVVSAQMDCARGMDKGLGWAKVLFADEPVIEDRIRKINSCFPLTMIMSYNNPLHLGLVGAGSFKEILLHGFKAGEKVKIFVDGDYDLLFWLMPDSKHPCPPTALRVAAGTTIEDLATILGNLANRHLMVTAVSLTHASHYELTVIPA
jgi:hypothetical protein